MTKCHNCETEETPMWRRCLDTDFGSLITLCNACGLYYKAKGDHRPRLLITKKHQISKYEHLMNCLASEADETDTKLVHFDDNELSDVRIISCVNCKCINTSLWRKDHAGNSMCNACGLYYKKNGVHRPVKEDDRDIFIEIDSNVIRFNKIKRRHRGASRTHQKAYERAAGIKKIELVDKSKEEYSKTVLPSPTSPSYAYSYGSDSSSTSPELNYTFNNSAQNAFSMGSPVTLPPPTLLLPNEHHSLVSAVRSSSVGSEQGDVPRLPSISVLLNAIGG